MKKYTKPYDSGYTIYTISNCKYCTLIKNNINKCKIINCDNYIKTLRERDDFYKFIEKYTIIPYKYFPMVFNKGAFVGGYKEWLNSKNNKI